MNGKIMPNTMLSVVRGHKGVGISPVVFFSPETSPEAIEKLILAHIRRKYQPVLDWIEAAKNVKTAGE